MGGEQAQGYVPSGVYYEERQEALQRESDLRERIKGVETQLSETTYVTYKDLWKDWWKIAGVLVTFVGVGAAVVLAASRVLP